VEKRIWRAAISVSLIIAAMVSIRVGIAFSEITIGTPPIHSAAELQAIYGPLLEYLARETGEKVRLVVPKDFEAFKQAVKAGQMDAGFANPLIYVQLKNKVDIEPLALSSETKSGTRFRGILIARKDSEITRPQDLRGKKISFIDQDSAAGYVFQMLLLSRAGLDINKDIIMLPFMKKHENVIMAVLNKTADAGCVREEEFEKMRNKVDFAQLRIVGYTDYFPNWPFFATPKLKKSTAEMLRTALLKLRPNDPQNEKVLGTAQLTGFIAVSDKDYDDLRKAAKAASVL
jgi:phosphonate transport system substrate-binding protein